MSLAETTAPRQNADGECCPPWCVTDHGKYGFHGSERVTVEAPEFHRVSARALYSTIGGTTVQVLGDGIVRVPSGYEAGELAALIEGLAAATPEQHRELAAAIRHAAAVITKAGRG